MSELIDFIDVKRLRSEDFWLDILSERRFDSSVYKAIREKYKEKADKAFRISVTRLVSCPYYSTFFSEEYGSHYYLRGKLFEEALIDYLARERKLEELKRQVFLYNLIELDEVVKGYEYAIIHGFADAIARKGNSAVIIEAKSSFGKPRIITRIAQLATYVRLYNETIGNAYGLLIAYIEERDPPIAIRRVSVKKDLKKFVLERVKAYIRLEKNPIDKSVCDVCPIRDKCEFRTRSPYRA